MAEVIREGGSNPIIITDWRTSLQVFLLEKMYDEGKRGAHKDELWARIRQSFSKEDDILPEVHGRKITRLDMDLELRGMFAFGLIEVSEFPCECCKYVGRNLDETLKHAIRLRLTKIGYEKVPEHILP